MADLKIEYPITEVTLPSNGKLYDSSIVGESVSIRPITTKEEKILYGSSSNNALDMVIKNCIVEPSSLNLDNLIIPDKYAILINLRIISIGQMYHVVHRCPYCNQDCHYDIDLSELPVNYLDSDFEEPIRINLDSIDSVVEIKLLRGKELTEVEEMVKRIKKRSTEYQMGDIGYTLRLAKYIKTINGEPVTFDKALKFVEGWTTKTSNEFKDAIDDIRVGYDIELFKDCTSCGEELEFNMPFNGEFFRPTRRR